MAAIEPFVYRKYFSFSEINEVKALKRQMEARTRRAGADDTDVKTGRGGIRDIEYTVQFLQLLNGGDLPAVRQRNTLLALDALELAGCLTAQEAYRLADAYRFLRKTEHRLQLLFDRQTHSLPASAEELDRLARRMGFGGRAEERRSGGAEEIDPNPAHAGLTPSLLGSSAPRLLRSSAQRRSPLDEQPAPPGVEHLLVEPTDQFLKAFHDQTLLDRTILDHLLHQTFAGGEGESEPESDLVLGQEPDAATVRAVLGRYPFRDVPAAYANLVRLASEDVPFLSHRRCRHFLASIAPALVKAVAATPDPDDTLATLERVTASLGGKAVLYELFSASPPTLSLYVDLCATSPFLSGVLVNNPGMIDELLDSLLLDQSRTAAELRDELAELLRGASDPDPILHSFQDKELLRIGVRDLLRRDDVRQTTAALTDLADALLGAVLTLVEPGVRQKYGVPTLGFAPCRYAVVGLGKLGGREMTFHSDLDLLLLYEADGRTTTGADNGQFFTELAQRTIKLLGRAGPLGKLYAVDMRLRPAGASGSLALSLAEFARYFAGGGAQVWERLAVCRGRVVAGHPVVRPGGDGGRPPGGGGERVPAGGRRRGAGHAGQAHGGGLGAEPEARPRRAGRRGVRRPVPAASPCRRPPGCLHPERVGRSRRAVRRRTAALGGRGEVGRRVLVPAGGRGPGAADDRPRPDGAAGRRRRLGQAGPPAGVRRHDRVRGRAGPRHRRQPPAVRGGGAAIVVRTVPVRSSFQPGETARHPGAKTARGPCGPLWPL